MAESRLRDGIVVNTNYQMSYERVYNSPSLAGLRQQIAECEQQIAHHTEQLRRLEGYPGDKSVLTINLRNSQRRLEQLTNELAEY